MRVSLHVSGTGVMATGAKKVSAQSLYNLWDDKMILFWFFVNKSFLTKTTHPITVPRSQVDYKAIKAAGIDQSRLIVILPRGQRFEAHLYSGVNNRGHFLQLVFHGDDRRLPGYLNLNDHLIVLLFRLGLRSYAVLEYRE